MIYFPLRRQKENLRLLQLLPLVTGCLWKWAKSKKWSPSLPQISIILSNWKDSKTSLVSSWELLLWWPTVSMTTKNLHIWQFLEWLSLSQFLLIWETVNNGLESSFLLLSLSCIGIFPILLRKSKRQGWQVFIRHSWRRNQCLNSNRSIFLIVWASTEVNSLEIIARWGP